MHNTTYQPPATFSNLSPQQYQQNSPSKYPQPPPVISGQIANNPVQVGVDPQIAQQKLLLKKELQMKDASLSGCFGWSCRVWFSITTVLGALWLFDAVNKAYYNYRWYQAGYLYLSVVLGWIFTGLFCTWLVVQSFLTIVNVGKKDSVRGKKLWISMICLTVVYSSGFAGFLINGFDTSAIHRILLIFLFPVYGSLLCTGVLKSHWSGRQEIVQKLEALSVENP